MKEIEPSLTPLRVLKRTPPRWELGMSKSLRVRKERQAKQTVVERSWENPLGWGCRLCKDVGCRAVWTMCRRHQGSGASQGETGDESSCWRMWLGLDIQEGLEQRGQGAEPGSSEDCGGAPGNREEREQANISQDDCRWTSSL